MKWIKQKKMENKENKDCNVLTQSYMDLVNENVEQVLAHEPHEAEEVSGDTDEIMRKDAAFVETAVENESSSSSSSDDEEKDPNFDPTEPSSEDYISQEDQVSDEHSSTELIGECAELVAQTVFDETKN